MAIKVGGITVVDAGRNLANISGGAITGIQSSGLPIGAGATTLNFTGSGNELTYDSATKTIDISIAGGGGGGGGSVDPTGILTTGFYSNPSIVANNATLNQPNQNYFMVGPVTVASGVNITVGTSNTFRIL